MRLHTMFILGILVGKYFQLLPPPPPPPTHTHTHTHTLLIVKHHNGTTPITLTLNLPQP